MDCLHFPSVLFNVGSKESKRFSFLFSLNVIELEVYAMQSLTFFSPSDLSGFYQPSPSRVVDIVYKQY